MRVRVCVRVRACVRVQKAAAMSSGLDLRKRGKRVDPAKRGPRSQRPSPLTAIDAGDPGEIRISNDTMIALQHLYNSSPSIQAARAILQGQLLSSGCVVRRGGRDVNLKDTFSRHLEDVWVPFARGVIDHFLMFGFVVVSLEEEGPPPFANFVRGKQMAATSHMGPLGDRDAGRREPLSASEMRRKLPITDDSRLDARAAAGKLGGGVNLVPAIPDIGQYELSFVHVGEVCCVQFKPSKHTHTHTHAAVRSRSQTNYKRQYRIFATNSDNVRKPPARAHIRDFVRLRAAASRPLPQVYRQDYSSEVFFKTPPDIAGNMCSPVATVFQSASFISALEELALQAEVVRARQMLVTQPAVRQVGNQNLDPANLFFDSESRAVQASASAEDDVAQAQSLATQAKMMQIINRLQTTDPATGRERPGVGRGRRLTCRRPSCRSSRRPTGSRCRRAPARSALRPGRPDEGGE